MTMTDRDFVTGVQREVLDTNWQIYKQLFAETELRSATDPYWQEALRLYASLDDARREVLFKIIRQVMVDTISNVFGVLDGVTRLKQQSGELVLEVSGRKMNGALQDLFLEMEEHRASE